MPNAGCYLHFRYSNIFREVLRSDTRCQTFSLLYIQFSFHVVGRWQTIFCRRLFCNRRGGPKETASSHSKFYIYQSLSNYHFLHQVIRPSGHRDETDSFGKSFQINRSHLIGCFSFQYDTTHHVNHLIFKS